MSIRGKFELSFEKSFSEGLSVIEITFEVDINGIFKFNALELGPKIPQKSEGFNYVNRLTNSEISRMIEEGKEFTELDLKYFKKVGARNRLKEKLAILKKKIGMGKYTIK
ncbi:78 kDa glucose-regulated protein [Smittium culicis]|uniref:78 kDa glucose-regulated protein n=1 Tax=Smittium culicis TaxID=133412 RepID=A0A1R1XJG8_9FUNG|nr:78 kDa glucose-regulated protein [Smittium culicis]